VALAWIWGGARLDLGVALAWIWGGVSLNPARRSADSRRGSP